MSGCSDILAQKDARIRELEAERDAAQDRALAAETERDKLKSDLDELRGEMSELAEHFGR